MQYSLLHPMFRQQHISSTLRCLGFHPPHYSGRAIRVSQQIELSHTKHRHTARPYSPPIPQSSSALTRPDPHNYTSGRWLHHDSLQRKARYINFDFDKLCSKVIKLCPGAKSITSYSKIEGGYNRVFIFRTDNAQRIVARLPFAVAGPARLSTSSEVATIKYLQAKTSIPIPKILDWSDDASNTIGSEYIIMEHAPGVCLHQKWHTMEVSEQLRCICAIYKKLKEVANLSFPAYGSLCFGDTSYLDSSKLYLDEEFCIGPHCGARYWSCSVGQPRYCHDVEPNRGPCKLRTSLPFKRSAKGESGTMLMDYCDGLIDTGLARLPSTESSSPQPRYQGSVQEHQNLLREGRAMVKQMAADPLIKNVSIPVLFHPDLHKRNIFVSDSDPTIITAIID